MILAISKEKNINTSEAILFCLEYAFKKKKKSWYNR